MSFDLSLTIEFQVNDAMTYISLPALTYIGSYLQIDANNQLKSLSLPSLVYVGGSIKICNNKAGLFVPLYLPYLGLKLLFGLLTREVMTHIIDSTCLFILAFQDIHGIA